MSAGKHAGSALYRRLIKPIESRLLGAETVAFVPDGVLAGTPFSALIDERGAYLLERYTLLSTPSAAAFEAAAERRASRPHPPRSVLIVANSAEDADQQYLAAVENEAANVARAYRTSIVLQNEKASLAAMTAHTGDADVLHFGGHAVGNDGGFAPAAIMLREGDHSRRVEAAEIARIPLPRTSTVVLAGCGTARGPRSGTEGVISVTHGFLAAGVPSVIATLWPSKTARRRRFSHAFTGCSRKGSPRRRLSARCNSIPFATTTFRRRSGPHFRTSAVDENNLRRRFTMGHIIDFIGLINFFDEGAQGKLLLLPDGTQLGQNDPIPPHFADIFVLDGQVENSTKWAPDEDDATAKVKVSKFSIPKPCTIALSSQPANARAERSTRRDRTRWCRA